MSASGVAPGRGALVGAGLGALVGAAGAAALVVGPEGWLEAGLTRLATEAFAAWAARGTALGAGVGLATALAARAGGRRVGALVSAAAALGAGALLLQLGPGLDAYLAGTRTVERLAHAGALAMPVLVGVGLARRGGRAARIAALPALLALLAYVGLPFVRPAATGPNLLFLSVDTLRADRLGCYGHARARTPVIDGLAARGTLYETVIASAPVTLTATSTLMTGLDPTDHGVHYNGYYRLGPGATTLAELLADRGWSTGAVIGNYALSGRFGIGQGFADYDDTMTQMLQPERAPRRGGRAEDREGETSWTRHLRNEPAQRLADEVTDAALGWLARRDDGAPWFLWVHYMDPHSPYAPPAAYRGVGDAYDGEVAFVDHEIGRLLDGLAARAPDAPTLIVLVADHGENLGEHGYSGHVRSVDEVALRVPLIVVPPGAATTLGTEPAGGARDDGPRRGRDVAGMVLAALGVRDPPPAMRPPTPPGDAWWTYAQTYATRFLDGEAPTRVLRERRWKFVDRPGDADALFDLSSDPAEDRDRAAAEAERAAAMRARLATYVGEVHDAPDAVDDETRAVLEQLGYVGDH